MDTPTGSSRKKLALRNVASRRRSIAPDRAPVDLTQLVRVYFLDGSSKVLQMKESSTCRNVLEQLKFNMDLISIKTLALYRVCGSKYMRLGLGTKIKDAQSPKEGEGEAVRILLRSWICDMCGPMEKEAMQDGIRVKACNSALWLKYLEAMFMVVTGKCYLTEDEALLLGCLKMQADSGDYRSSVHTLDRLKERVSTSFPEPAQSRMRSLQEGSGKRNDKDSARARDMAARVQLLYARLAGNSKPEAQIQFIRTLQSWCPFYGATFFSVDCQYDDDASNPDNEPPVIRMTAAVTHRGIFLLTRGSPPIILRQPYNRIVKWSCHPDMHIFCFWVLKEKYHLRDVLALFQLDQDDTEEDEGEGEVDEETRAAAKLPADFDPSDYCDCIYLVTEEAEELDFLVRCNVNMLQTGEPPLLPGDTPDEGEEENTVSSPVFGVSKVRSENMEGRGSESSEEASQHREKKTTSTSDSSTARRTSVLNSFFQALSGGGLESSVERGGQGVSERDFHQSHDSYCDDTATLTNSVFRTVDRSDEASGEDEEQGALGDIDMMLASSMSELSGMQSEKKSARSVSASSVKSPPPRRSSLFRWASMSSVPS